MIPVLNRIGARNVDIPAFSGGINMRDGARNIRDNQLTESVNLWYKDGALRTRPRLVANTDDLGMIIYNKDGQKVTVSANNANRIVVDGNLYFLEVTTFSNYGSLTANERIKLRYKRNNDGSIGGEIIDDIVISDAPTTDLKSLAIQHNGDIYVYARYFYNNKWCFRIYRVKNNNGRFDSPVEVTEDAYAPLALTNGVAISVDGQKISKGTQVEGYNLLSRYYRMQFSSYNPESNEDKTPMEFALNFSINDKGYEGTKIIVVNTTKSGEIIRHEAIVERTELGTYEAIESNSPSSNYIYVKNNVLQFLSLNDNGNLYYESKENYLQNNIEVTAPYATDSEYKKNVDKIMAMSQMMWFGNTSLGLNGGSRLFLSGNAAEPALVVWSDFENPLYFSENNYAYVGDKGQKVVAFGMQASNLIVFKEREIYATQYVQGDVTAEELVNQSAIDITTRLAQFPVCLIHQNIGCDSPNSVQLCRNRLVWAFDHKIYTLTGANQYSERNVLPVSEMISSELAHKDLKNARSADWDNRYLLFVDDAVYVLEYDSYGYTNISSYTKNDDANVLIPWYKWTLPINNIISVVSAGTDLLIFADVEYSNTQNAINMFSFWENADGYDVITDGTKIPIECTFTTKQFDLGAPDYYKSINSVYIEAECSTPISLEMHTERKFADKGKLNKATRHFIPYMRLNRYFALKIACSGIVEFKGMTINYKTAGVVR